MSGFKEVRKGFYEFRLELGYLPSGKRNRKFRTLPCKNDTEAKKILARLSVELEDGKLADHSKMTFEDLYEKWKVEFAPFKLDAQTQETYQYVIEDSLLPEFRKARIQNLKANDFISYFNREIKKSQELKEKNAKIEDTGSKEKKEKVVGDYTFEKRHRCLRSLYKYVMQLEIIKEDISQEVPKPKVKARKKDYYEDEEIIHLFDVVKLIPHHQALMVTLAVTGALRRGEVLGIDMYKDIDFVNNTIHISRSVQKTKEYGLRVKDTKTEDDRIVTFDEVTMAEVQAYLLEREKEIEQIGDEYKGFRTIYGEKVDLLFAHIDGTPYDPNSVSQFWSRIVKRHNLKKIAFHDLRHTSASYLLGLGFSMKAIQERLGHSDIKTTMNLYTHVNKNLNKALGDAFLNLRK
ncbi:site-specific integrase [Neobacillus sp. MM2021_6]|uniref:tyrosine-type recombinase/integrase n=1 Tax=Bacillaceae TaxID=186817 RepID=UPI001409827D|nr:MULTISPECIES: site-specific integrase [Bacillaceae]MBO0962384.1 site-specific integrase [Neobacillus sp. MM2021_6]NHC20864.1 site-specific integrase [Bacillus sp. MM2020_4]